MAFGQYLGYIGGVIGAVIGGVIGTYVFPGVGTGTGALWGFSIGSMVGGVAGQVFWPEQAELNLPPPPQPHETRLQFSSWGAAIPIQYASGRLAGNIIYMSDIVETIDRSRHRQDGVRYYEMVRTYTATFAIAFCEGPVTGVSRIWVNNKVFADWRDPTSEYFPVGSYALAFVNLSTTIDRGATYFSIYLGSESQTADASLVALLTDAETPAYKGLCYIVFKDFPIGEFSGVPNIEVEIGESIEPEDFTTWQWTPDAYMTVAKYEVYQSLTRVGSNISSTIFSQEGRTFNEFNIVYEWELVSLTPVLGPVNYSLFFTSKSGPNNGVYVGIDSASVGSYRISLVMVAGASTQTVYGMVHTSLPIKRIFNLIRTGTTVTLNIYDEGAFEEMLTLTHASFTRTDFDTFYISTFLQTGTPAISFYVRNMYIDEGV